MLVSQTDGISPSALPFITPKCTDKWLHLTKPPFPQLGNLAYEGIWQRVFHTVVEGRRKKYKE